jgi:plastocyanin
MNKAMARSIQIAMLGLIVVGAAALQISCKPQRVVGICGGGSTPHSVTIGVANGVLSLSADPVRVCPGDTVAWSRQSGTDTNTYTVQFESATADACGWSGGSQTIPVTCTIPSGSPPTSGNGDKYNANCSAGTGCTGVSPLDPHIIIM